MFVSLTMTNIFSGIVDSILHRFRLFSVEVIIQNLKIIRDNKNNQDGHGTGKTGNVVLTFSSQGKHREFYCDTGKTFGDTGKIFDYDYDNIISVFDFEFQNVLAWLHSA